MTTEQLERSLRSDALPENQTFRDTGCSLHSSCLSCPFDRCRYDIGIGGSVRANERGIEVKRLRSLGWTGTAIARHLGITVRSVWRLSK